MFVWGFGVLGFCWVVVDEDGNHNAWSGGMKWRVR